MFIRVGLPVIIFICLLILGNEIVRTKGESINKETKKIIDKTKSSVKSKYSIMLGNNDKHLKSLNFETRQKSNFYKYYSTFYIVINDLKLNDYLRPELLFIYICIVSSIVSLIICIGTNIMLSVFVAVTLCMTIHMGLIYISKINGVQRVISVLDAIDILSSDIGKGFKKSVQENIDSIDSSIKAPFYEFLNTNTYNTPNFISAVIVLNSKLGKSFDTFSEQVVNYEITGSDTLLYAFKDIIKENSKKKIIYLQQIDSFRENSKIFGYIVLVVIGFYLAMSALFGVTITSLFTTFKTPTLLIIVTLMIAYVKAQLVYTEGL